MIETREEGMTERVRMFTILDEVRFVGIRALAFAVYEEDFYATREASRGDGDFYTFKDGGEWAQGPEFRGRAELQGVSEVVFHVQLIEQHPHRFAQVDDNLVILLGCPKSATCNAQDLFIKQLTGLERILEVDNVEFVLCNASSPSARNVRQEYEDTESGRILLGCHVALERCNFKGAGETNKVYEMRALQIKCERGAPTALEVRREYESERTMSFVNVTTSWSSAVETRGRMKTDRTSSLALTKYGVSFVSTRDGSECAGRDCVFSFKKASDALVSVLEVDEDDFEGDVAASWFDMELESPALRVRQASFYVMVRPLTDEEAVEFGKAFNNDAVGKILECWVEFERRHWNTSEGLVKVRPSKKQAQASALTTASSTRCLSSIQRSTIVAPSACRGGGPGMSATVTPTPQSVGSVERDTRSWWLDSRSWGTQTKDRGGVRSDIGIGATT
ncbi:hypothetical protein B0H16DRAFT_1448422 [Mycena metata]|uniref:Uncharacterized protein n=1 Tax=Mycena metata TaxID=1033252 RepID=A0AAD7K9I7_9AGAR|nr:hypothetical protein B0H16DRAFT_1448422 [Mycena metata]